MMHLNPLVLRLKEKCKNTIHEEQSSRIDLTVRVLSYWKYSGIRSTTHLKTAKNFESYIHLNILSQPEAQLSYIREYNSLSHKSIININFLPTLSINNQEKWLRELMKWSPRGGDALISCQFFKKYMEIRFNKQDNSASAEKFSHIRQRKRVRSIEMKFARSWIHFTSKPLLLYIAVVVA